MAKTFHLTIARLGENVFDGEALSVHLPGIEGDFTVLAGHEALVSELKEGKISYEDAAGQRHEVPIASKGIAEVSGNQATILL